MRLAAAALLLLPLAATAAASGATVIVLGIPPTIVTCDDSTTDVAALPNVAGWSPQCVQLASGDAVTWHAAPDHPHAAASTAPPVFGTGTCFNGPTLTAGATNTVRLTYDASLHVHAQARNADGSWAPTTDCYDEQDHAQSTTTQGVLPYVCRIHPSMKGYLVITSA